jgi:hypothetical protein
MRATVLLAAMMGPALALPALGQEREVELFRLPPQHEPTTPGTYRDPAADAIDTAHESVGRMATTKIEKFSRWDRAGFTERARKVQYQQQTKLVKGAGELAGNTYFKALGWVNTLADGGATIAGHLAAKDLGGAAVAALDESAQSVAAAGGAWAFGKIGVGLGAMFGGPPGAMIGGAVGGIVGSVVTTVGYNAYASETVSAIGEQAVEPVRPENYYREEARKNRIEWLIANGYPIPAILFEQDWAERDRQFRAADSQPTPVFVVGPPEAEPAPPSGATTPPATSADAALQAIPWIHQGLWLPEKYLPRGFRHYDSDRKPEGDPPRSNGSQSVWYGIPLKKKGGQPSSSSGEHPYTVFLDGMIVFKSVKLAQQHVQMMRESLSAKTSVPLGEEAYLGDNCKGDDGSLFNEYSGRDGIWGRALHVYLVRVGRVTFGLRVSGDRVKDYDRTAAGDRDFVAHETPTREELMGIAQAFVGAVRRYAEDKGWLWDH